MTVYYNEIEPNAVAVLKELIKRNVIAPGDVDDRSIKDVAPDDLKGYDQCHFFAGGGLWSVAARLAGWPDDKPLWTASCPCQPFSQAGKGGGTADERHLWPDLFRLVRAARPPVLVGEQVAGAAGYSWFDGVGTDLGGEGYASRAVDIPAAAVDAPHIRQRLYWIAVRDMADAERAREGRRQLQRPRAGAGTAPFGAPDQSGRADSDRERQGELVDPASQRRREGRAESELRCGRPAVAGADAQIGPGHAIEPGLEGQPRHGDGEAGRAQPDRPVAEADGRDVGHAAGDGRQQRQPAPSATRHGDQSPAAYGRNGSFWSDHEWLLCHDGKARRTQPGLRLLVDGLPGRVGLWRIGGNAIVAPLAAEILKAYLETE